MTAIAAHLGQRTFEPSEDSALDAQVHALSDLRVGDSARIIGYAAALPASTARRLFDLGFAPGATIEVVRRAPAMDPVIYRVAECELALRRSLAAGLVVALV